MTRPVTPTQSRLSRNDDHLRLLRSEPMSDLTAPQPDHTRRATLPQARVAFDTEARFLIRVQPGVNRLERGLELLRKAQGQTT